MTERPTVYYDGGCPVCSREISFYQRRPGAECLAWVDVTKAEFGYRLFLRARRLWR